MKCARHVLFLTCLAGASLKVLQAQEVKSEHPIQEVIHLAQELAALEELKTEVDQVDVRGSQTSKSSCPCESSEWCSIRQDIRALLSFGVGALLCGWARSKELRSRDYVDPLERVQLFAYMM